MKSKLFHSKLSSDLDASSEISNAKLVEQFRDKRVRWFSWHELNLSEPNSIEKQLLTMLSTDMQYRVFRAESEKLAPGEGLAIPFVVNLSNIAYVLSQVFSIRRLVDGRADVISLTRVLSELKQSRHLITRENYVSYDGTPYDPTSWQLSASSQQIKEHIIFGIYAPGLSEYLKSTIRHDLFDSLAGVGSEQRQRTDLIRPEVFETLEMWIKNSGAKKLITMSHKYFAHAAQASTIMDTLEDVDLGEIEFTQRPLVRTSRAIFNIILRSEVASEPVPMSPLGFFGTVWKEDSLIESTCRMQKHWDELAKVRNAWAFGIEEELFGPQIPTA